MTSSMLTTPYKKPTGMLVGLSLALLFGVGSIGLGITNRFGLDDQANQRNTDRIESDLASCERGNVLRQTLLDIGHANERMITAILDNAFTPSGKVTPAQAAEIEAFRQRLDAPIAEYDAAVSKIRLVDCAEAVPGAKEQP